METALIEMSPRHARTEAERYARCSNLTDRDKAILRAYRSIAHGGRILDLHATVEKGGAHDSGVPKLAVVRANATRVDLQLMPGLMRFQSDKGHWKTRTLEMPNFWRGQSGNVWAEPPHIPPYLRPADPGEYFLLWEATWRARPKGDPILLKHVGKNLYRVVAAWDLTPVEASIL